MSPIPLRTPRILIVDDDADARALVATWLEGSGYEPVMASSPLDAIALLNGQSFDVVVTDLRMPGLDGLQLQTILEKLAPDVPLIFLSGQGTMDEAIKALRGGRAFDFLRKPLRNMRELNTAIEAALGRARLETAVGEAAATSPESAEVLVSAKRDPGERIRTRELTPTELRMMTLLAQGFDNHHIATTMALSEKTVRNYLSRVYGKLGVDSRLQAVAVCRSEGVVD